MKAAKGTAERWNDGTKDGRMDGRKEGTNEGTIDSKRILARVAQLGYAAAVTVWPQLG